MFDPGPFETARFERALRRLHYLDRQALLLKARDHLSYGEIGAVLGLTAAAAEARVVSALVKLHARLARERKAWWRWW
jgi:DNA-directed RNA polymerase specialized sigma24 family protein